MKEFDDMTKMFRSAGWTTAVAAAAVALCGCEWEGTDQSESISQRYNWVNFSAVYRPATNGYLVAESTSGLDTEGNTVTSETIGTGNGIQTLFSAVLDNAPVVAGSVSVAGAGFALSDNGNGLLVGSGKTGSVNYATGAISVNYAPAAPAAGATLTATYQYEPGSSGGNTGEPIFSFTVQQSGNSITMVDNNGATYSGTISSITGTGGASGDEPSLSTPSPASGDTVTGSFEVEGRSSAGLSVRIVGTLVGTVVGVAATDTTASSIRLQNRAMHGTWIEAGGQTADVYGVAAD